MITDEQHAALLVQFKRLGVDVIKLGRAEHYHEVVVEARNHGVHAVVCWPEDNTTKVIQALIGCADGREVWYQIRLACEQAAEDS